MCLWTRILQQQELSTQTPGPSRLHQQTALRSSLRWQNVHFPTVYIISYVEKLNKLTHKVNILKNIRNLKKAAYVIQFFIHGPKQDDYEVWGLTGNPVT